MEEHVKFSDDYTPQFSGFHDLMSFRVREILLVSSAYDAFVLEEDGRLSEKIFSEYLDLNLQFVPRIRRVSTAEEAFSALQERTYDLIITMARISDMNLIDFGRRVKALHPGVPVVMLTYDSLNKEMVFQIRESKVIDKIFYWSGNNKILLAIIKYVEDLGNVEADSKQGVQVILVVEDSTLYYSQLLPIIYTEIMKQTRYLISHGVNDLQKLLRMRARPKILLANTYEEAMDIFNRYSNNLLGIISDTGFPKGGSINAEAGFDLARKVKEAIYYLPFLLQSEEQDNEERARSNGISFLNKNSPNLHMELRTYILDNYGFGDFIFRYPDGREISRASSMDEFERILKDLPEESLLYHANRYHFSCWLRARTEFLLAEEIRHKQVSDFLNTSQLREFILSSIRKYVKLTQEGIITDFGVSRIDANNSFIKLGSGSLGGKGRAIAFFNSLLAKTKVFDKYTRIKVKTPRSFVICSEVFEEFMEMNRLQEMAINSENEAEIAERFLSAQLPPKVVEDLRKLTGKITYPLAVRSSSILEDSQMLPFAGIYSTYVLPNNDRDPETRLKQLLAAVKLVYASVFYQSPKQYIKNADLRIEDEKMAVLIQQLVGEAHGDVFYPVVSGVAQSYNYYPVSYMKPEQGMVGIALGFGRIVVEGEQVYKFCPAYPEMSPPFLSSEDFLKKTQTHFYALNLKNPSSEITANQWCTYEKLGLERAEADGVLKYIASTYSEDDDSVHDTLSIKGTRVLTFASLLKYRVYPFADVINDLLALLKQSFSADVEIEFAMVLPDDGEKEAEFYLLQIRPMVAGREVYQVKVDVNEREDLILSSSHTIGNGIFQNIFDLIFVDPDLFDLNRTRKVAEEIGELNRQLVRENRKCILMGFGRLGTSDPWLGIPLKWGQMSQAKVVIEADWGHLQAEPSLGSHFYHNLTSLKMGYFHLEESKGTGFFDWKWIKEIPVFRRTKFVKHVRFDKPLLVKIDGRTGRGVILKPGKT
ncbi:MAG: PEP/pyruvate-binding domain-containing protein [Clostridiales bacterium]|jgi:septum formation topological specificity factor MinE|nr:phosphoenolpyruvate synthase [Eubacteriales bacterium]MDH7566623.1 PEP/pyruvate-binding domain-containing protein [Clostridiales bacterium]